MPRSVRLQSPASAFFSFYPTRLLPTPATLLILEHTKLFLTSGPLHSHLLCPECSSTRMFSSQIFRSFLNYVLHTCPVLEPALPASQEPSVKSLRSFKRQLPSLSSLQSAVVGMSAHPTGKSYRLGASSSRELEAKHSLARHWSRCSITTCSRRLFLRLSLPDLNTSSMVAGALLFCSV